MKTAVRIFALGVVIAGAVAAANPNSTKHFVSHQAASVSTPVPTCTVTPSWCAQNSAK